MKRKIFVRRRAEQDIEEARSWYDGHDLALGNHFLEEVDRAIQSLEDAGDRFPVYYRKFRKVLLIRFPYKIFYSIDEKTVVVFRILHARRDHGILLK